MTTKRKENREKRLKAYLEAFWKGINADEGVPPTMAGIARMLDAAVGTAYTYLPNKESYVRETLRNVGLERLAAGEADAIRKSMILLRELIGTQGFRLLVQECADARGLSVTDVEQEILYGS